MSHSIGSVISFCTNEIRFLKHCIESLKNFSSEIGIVVFDHFFDGTPENKEALFYCFEQFPECRFFLSPFVPKLLSEKFTKRIGKDLWFNCSRIIGQHFATSEYLLFLDADEIVDEKRFSAWLDAEQYRVYDAMRLANYWYFRTPEMQASCREDSAVLARRGSWQKKALLSPGDRHALYNAAKKKMRHVLGLDGEPMIHHYSWVRTKEEILKKMKASAHKNENDWEKLIENEWSNPYSIKDFVHGYELKKVDPFIELDLTKTFRFKEEKQILPSNVYQISPLEFLKMVGTPFWRRAFYSCRGISREENFHSLTASSDSSKRNLL